MRDPDRSEVQFFETPAALAAWFRANHDHAEVLWVGYFRKATDRASITWEESVDEALCVGWIDGIRKRIDEQAYCIRFTPRRPRSNWSRVNQERYAVLDAAGRILPAGRAAHEAGDHEKESSYSYERARAAFDPDQLRRFRASARAWAWFENQPPGYRRTVTHWVTSAKREATRASRLERLIAACEDERRLF